MFNPADPYYLGDLPSIGAMIIGFGLVMLVGWAVDRSKK